MIVDVTASGVSLRDVRVFDDLHVEVAPDVDLVEALTIAGAGRPADDGDVFVSIAWVRAFMADLEDDDEEWRTGFEAMLGFARSQGWVDGDGVRAHVVERD